MEWRLHWKWMMFRPFLLTTLVALAAAGGIGCAAPSDEEEVGSSGSAIREDTSREPQTVWVPVRFTRNSVDDVGYVFKHSWLPFTGVAREQLDGFTWGYWTPGIAKNISTWYQPDVAGAGYATAWFKVMIPYSTEGKIAYELTRVKLDSEFLRTDIAWRNSTTYSPLRVRAGSDQPCVSITMSGGLDGKFRSMPLPFTDQDFTERDWKEGDTDASGRPIKRVIVGSLHFGAVAWPENVEGKTNLAGGVAAGNAFLMVDKSDGQAQSGSAKIHVNLVENDRGQVSVGATFSTNGGVLSEREVRQFDAAVKKHRARWDAERKRGEDASNEAWAAQGNAPIF
ncbi:MAG: hypothetical protein KC657_02665 [Myxococcales bacterium]|nr:hypothetical protein [Myxococcales bacterium]